MTSPFRRCLWPGCSQALRAGAGAELLYCSAHHEALTGELRAQLRNTYGTMQWLDTVQHCQGYARSVIQWLKSDVTGGRRC
jgi:hypothetical protein